MIATQEGSHTNPSTDVEEEDTENEDDQENKSQHQNIPKLLSPSEVSQSVQVGSGTSITEAIGRHLDTRAHIVGELYDTEKTYCEVLRSLHENYLIRYLNLNNSKNQHEEPLQSPSK